MNAVIIKTAVILSEASLKAKFLVIAFKCQLTNIQSFEVFTNFAADRFLICP